MAKKIYTLFFLLGLGATIRAWGFDSGQLMPGQSVKPEDSVDKKFEKYDSSSSFVPGLSDPNWSVEKSKSPNDTYSVPGSKSDLSDGDFKVSPHRGSTHGQVGQYDKRDTVLEANVDSLIQDTYNKGKRNFSFKYFRDSFEYKDDNNVFKKTFVDGPDSDRYGNFFLSWEFYFFRSGINLKYGALGGAGYMKGKGIFKSDQAASDATIALWSIPVDVYLGLEIPLGRFLKLNLIGGPSALLLWQNRNDRPSGDKRKNRRQYSLGFMAGGALQLPFSEYFRSLKRSLYVNYKISAMTMNLEARYQSYKNFKQNLSVVGPSFGIGFTFEYL